MDKHIPVLLDETINALQVKPDGVYIDLTLGRAGHATSILKKLNTGKLIAFDKDAQAIVECAVILNQISNNFQLIHSDFRNLKNELEKLGIKQVDGILADLGVSSPQIDDHSRGFSYNGDSKLDMRMDRNQSLDAHMIVNSWSEDQLVAIFRDYADVKLPRNVAKGIISNRPIESTLKLVEIIRSSLPAAVVRQKNPAKAVFQALRIAVNSELEALEVILHDAPSLLRKNGTLAIITFHSIEDRMVKCVFGEKVKDLTGKLPIKVIKKWSTYKVDPSENEITFNPRSRSARLRVLRKLED